MKNFIKRVIAFTVSASFLLPVINVYASSDEEKKNYIVLMSEPALYSPDRVRFYDTDTNAWENEVREYLLEEQANVKAQLSNRSRARVLSSEDDEGLHFTDVLNGFTAVLTEDEAERLRDVDGVESVIPDIEMDAPEPLEAGSTYAADDTTSNSEKEVSPINGGNLINADKMYNAGYNGEGRAVAVIDSELDFTHPFFTLTNPENAKFTKTDISTIIDKKGINAGNKSNVSVDDAYRSEKIPFAYNYADKNKDVRGTLIHGSHVSGIVAGNSMAVGGNGANGYVSGIAPEAQLLFFRVANSSGKILLSYLVASIDDAVKFGVDSINISIGSDYRSENYTYAVSEMREAVMNAENAGVSVVISAGNADKAQLEATKPDYSSADNGVFPYSTKVGSLHNTYTYSEYLTDNNENTYYCENLCAKAPYDFQDIALCDSGSVSDIQKADVKGKTAVIPLGYDIENKPGLSTSVANAVSAGAAAIVIVKQYNQITNGSITCQTPVFFMPRDVYETLKKNVAENNTTQLKYEAKSAIFNRGETPYRSYFSSYGISDNLDIAVDFSAPGGNIYSSVPTNEMANLSGTSMSAPQVTGALVLMSQFVEEKYPTYTASSKVTLMQNLLASTADTVYEENGVISSPFAVGSGLINLDKAMATKVILTAKNTDDNRINLGDNISNSFDVTFSVKNISENDVTFNNIKAEFSTEDYKYFDSVKKNGYLGMRSLTNSITGFEPVTIEAGGTSDVTVNVTLDKSELDSLSAVMTNGFFVGGKITLSGGDNCDVGIPLSGFYGNWNDMPVIDINSISNQVNFKAKGKYYYVTMPVKLLNDEPILYISENPDSMYDSSGRWPTLYTGADRNAFVSMSMNGSPIEMSYTSPTGFSNSTFLNKYGGGAFCKTNFSTFANNMGNSVNLDMVLPYYQDSDNKQSQTLSIKLVPDNEKPMLAVETYTDGEKTMAKVTASDNVSLASVYFTAVNENGETKSANKDVYGSKTQFTADITGLKRVNFVAADTALNVTYMQKIELDMEKGNAYVTADKDYTGIYVVFASYKDGRLVDCKFVPTDLLAGENKITIPDRFIANDTDEIKTMVWGNLKNAVPLFTELNN
ncbi:MAG: S8 family serine peptidase [Clostridiales bacterium]|nr:S8 family serine peptidase [Clostridiales bacterium]